MAKMAVKIEIGDDSLLSRQNTTHIHAFYTWVYNRQHTPDCTSVLQG